MIDADVMELRDIQHIVGSETVGVDTFSAIYVSPFFIFNASGRAVNFVNSEQFFVP